MSKLNPKDTVTHLTEQGKPITETTLSQLRTTGGGPPFYKEDNGKYIWYDTDDLDEWSPMKKIPKPMTKYNSTREYRKKKS